MPAIIGALVAFLIQALRQFLPGIVGRILLAFGVGLATYKLALPSLIGMAESYFGRLPGSLYAYAGAIGLDVVAVMILSAFAANRIQRVVLSKLGPST